MSEKFAVKTKEDWKNHFSKQLSEFLNDYSNEIPLEIVHGNDPKNYKYKVRGNWINAVRNCLDNAEHMGMLSGELNTEWRNFFQKWGGDMAASNSTRRTTKEEIDTIDKLIKKAQDELCEGK